MLYKRLLYDKIKNGKNGDNPSVFFPERRRMQKALLD